MEIAINDIKDFLDEKYLQYNQPNFIENDPISIPHNFTKKEDIEIAAFLTATISWGQRITILKNANQLTEWMENKPHDFILNFTKKDLNRFKKFKHRTFNGIDCCYFMMSLQNIYRKHGGLENVFHLNKKLFGTNKIISAISEFRKIFFELPFPERTMKHVSDPNAGSATKRINMFLRWMVRKDNHGVDFGLWKNIPMSELYCPLDIHSGNVARKLNLLKRTTNDWKAVTELTENLRKFDPKDPIKYDFALFGLGVSEKF